MRIATTCSVLCAAAVVVMIAAAAQAQAIRPECAKMRDKVGCTCALENGGRIITKPGSSRRYWASRMARQAVNEGFVACMKRNGRS